MLSMTEQETLSILDFGLRWRHCIQVAMSILGDLNLWTNSHYPGHAADCTK